MAHFYDCKDVSSPSFEGEVTTPFQAQKKSPSIYPSVTTVLGIVKDSFIDSIWKPKMITALAREYPEMDWQDIERLTYGTRPHPVDGSDISSSEFGTSVHKIIEDIIDGELSGEGRQYPAGTAFDPWAMPFIEWIAENDVRPISCERMVASKRVKICGSVDFIGHDRDGKLFLADYKCRSNTKGKAKTYAKDCEQLAIESYMLMKEHKLDYLPACRSVVIDSETKQHIHREWTGEQLRWGIDNAKLCAKIYWNKRMNPKVK